MKQLFLDIHSNVKQSIVSSFDKNVQEERENIITNLYARYCGFVLLHSFFLIKRITGNIFKFF